MPRSFDHPLAATTAAATLAFALSLGGCAAHETQNTTDSAASAEVTAPAPDTLTVTATDFAFDMPAQTTAGVTTVKLINNGGTIHHVQLVRLDSGKTLQDLGAAMQNPDAPRPSWAHMAGGPNAIAPHDTATATMDLEPGNYAAICTIPGPDHMPHVAKGMVHPLTVVAAPAGTAPAAMPQADMTISLTDYAFALSDSLSAGHHVIGVSNAASQPHEVVLVRLDQGKTPNDVVTWVFNQKGPPPGVPVGGISGIEPGAHGTFTVDVPPGDYALICFLPDAKDAKPHAMHGMMTEIHVS